MCWAVGAQPGAAAPERHRPGDEGGHGQVRHPVPDIVIGCAGRRLQSGRPDLPFHGPDAARRGESYRFIAVEPASCPSLTRGKFAYDFCDTGMVCPLAKMYTLGSGFIPSA